jgi:hypothetical protein
MRLVTSLLLVFMFHAIFVAAESRDVGPRKIFTLVHAKYVGEGSQILGLARELSNLPQESIRFAEDRALTKPEIEAITGNPNNIFISSGKYGAQAIQKLKAICPTLVTVHVSHQVSTAYTGILLNAKTNVMALPAHVVNDDIRSQCKNAGVLLVETIGVSHSTDQNLLKEQHKLLASKLPEKPFDVLIIPGDTENQEGIKVPFKIEDARELVPRLAEHLGPKVLLISGPRTNQHKAFEGMVDPITNAFKEILESKGKRVVVFAYKETPGGYKAALHAMKCNQVEAVWVSGESTSMVSEIIDTAPESVNVVGYYQPIMTQVHKDHLDSERKTGRIKVFDGCHILQPEEDVLRETIPAGAAKTIATAVRSILKT